VVVRVEGSGWVCHGWHVSTHEREADRRARFEELARELIDPLRRYLARRTDPSTVDDVLADTLLVCWRRLDDVPDNPLPWAYGVARNCLSNAQRGERRRQRLAAKIAVVAPPEQASPGPDSRDDELLEALAALRPEDAELLRLWAWERLTPAEIATVLQVSANAASIRLHRARQKLRDELRKVQQGSGHEQSREGRGS
jgi:RNA polymerase sigma-70 factor, ECF subfamily